MKQEVQWYLVEALIRARGLAGLDDIAQQRSGVLAQFGGTLEAFRYLDAVSQDEVTDWNNRMLVALGLVPPEPLPPGRGAVARIGWIGDGEPPVYVPPTPSQFVRQVLGPDQEFEVFGGRLRVLAVEVYADCLAIRWRAAPEPDIRAAFPEETAALERDIEGTDEWAADVLRTRGAHQLAMRRMWAFELADDVGTEYMRRGWNSGSGGNGTSGGSEFTPAPPASATRVTLRWLGTTIDIPLS